MNALTRSTKFAIIFGVAGIAVGIGITLALVQTNDDDGGIIQRLVGDNRESSEDSFVKLKGVVRPGINHESILAPGEEGMFYADASGGTRPYQFQWDFGDGSPSSSLQNATHAFPSAGEYQVRLAAMDSNGIKGVISVKQSVVDKSGSNVP